MPAFAYYLLKIITCSGILYGYYLLGLRNKLFHRWNRFYLLAGVILSLGAPLIKINILPNADAAKTPVVQLLRVVNSDIVFEYSKGAGNAGVNASNFSLFIYIVVSVLLAALLIHTLLRIYRLKKDNRHTIVEGINFINTNAKGTPFSFFNNIFWNEKIDISSATGKQIFLHEVAHVREKHSYDKIFMNIVLIFTWCNPFFWLIRRELNMIHEFIADQEAVENSDTSAFAAMILQATYPRQQFTITNNFFYSPLKRRLIMLTKNKNPKISYLSRVLVLPLATLIFLAFTLKMKAPGSPVPYTGKKITVIIDAGHGGDDGGAKSENGIYEKNLTLSIAKKIKELNANKNITIVLSRDKDENIAVRERVDLAKSLQADLFISIHLDAETNTANSGLGIWIPNDDNPNAKKSKILGADINESFKNNYQLPVANDLKQREKGIWVLKANQCPSVIVEPGFISTLSDLNYLSNPENQQIIAKNILNGIEKYADQNLAGNVNTSITPDTVVPLRKGAAYIDTKNRIWLSSDTIINTTEASKTYVNVTKAVLIINGKIERNDILKNKTIVAKKLTIHSGDEKDVLNIYGEKAKNGVFVFEDAAIINQVPYYPGAVISKQDYGDDKIFTKVEVNPSFPGGEQALAKYMTNAIKKNTDDLTKDNQSGTCRVRFIVGIDGSISEITALSMQGTKLAAVAFDAITHGPKWVPAKQNNHLVVAYKEVPFTFTIQHDKIFTQVETEAQFPGGQQAWLKYTQSVIEKNADVFIKNNIQGTCLVRFIVDVNGNVSDVKATTMENTDFAEVAVNAIKQGPKWKPAIQNGHMVTSYKRQAITFKLTDNMVGNNEPK